MRTVAVLNNKHNKQYNFNEYVHTLHKVLVAIPRKELKASDFSETNFPTNLAKYTRGATFNFHSIGK